MFFLVTRSKAKLLNPGGFDDVAIVKVARQRNFDKAILSRRSGNVNRRRTFQIARKTLLKMNPTRKSMSAHVHFAIGSIPPSSKNASNATTSIATVSTTTPSIATASIATVPLASTPTTSIMVRKTYTPPTASPSTATPKFQSKSLI